MSKKLDLADAYSMRRTRKKGYEANDNKVEGQQPMSSDESILLQDSPETSNADIPGDDNAMVAEIIKKLRSKSFQA